MTRKLLFSAFTLFLSFPLHGATVLWNEATNGTLDSYPYAPTNGTFVIHSIGLATDDTNLVQGTVTISPVGGETYNADYDAFFFTVPPYRQFTGLLLICSPDLPSYTFGGLCPTASGIYYGTESFGTWVATNSAPATNDLFANLGLSVLPPGDYSMDVIPLLQDYNWPTNGTITYTLSILTSPMPLYLNISQSSNQLVISWSTNNAAGFSLQSTTTPNTPISWTTLTNIPTLVSNQLVVTSPMPVGNCFFRLTGPGS